MIIDLNAIFTQPACDCLRNHTLSYGTLHSFSSGVEDDGSLRVLWFELFFPKGKRDSLSVIKVPHGIPIKFTFFSGKPLERMDKTNPLYAILRMLLLK